MEARQTPTRDSFVEWVDERLTELSFCKSENGESWILEKEDRRNGTTMIINGHRINRPGEARHLKFQVEVFGNGDMKDISTERIDPFIEINFYIFENNSLISEWPTFCMFFDDKILFDSLLNEIFKL